MRKKLLSLILSFVLVATMCTLFTSCDEVDDTTKAGKLASFMEAYNKNHTFKYNGAILVAQDDEILLSKGYGVANAKEEIDNTDESVFAIGSITKSFTALCIMQLEEQGLLSVDDPISKYIDYTMRDNITIHQLLTHTSGMCREGVTSQTGITLDDHLEFIDKCALQFEPGQGFEYSNAGYILLANIVEKVSGESYNDYLKNHIFEPLNMNTSRGGTDLTYADNQSIGYTITTSSPKRMYIYDFSWITGGGNIYSNVGDMFNYSRGLDKAEIVSRESLDKIFTPCWSNEHKGYGYGWEVTKKYDSERISHGGCIGGGGYVSEMIRYPEHGYVLIFLTNNADTTALNNVIQSLEALLFNKDYVVPEKAKNIKVSEKLLKQYAGDYEIVEGVVITVSIKDGKLYSTADDGELHELKPLSKTRFVYDRFECTTGEFEVGDDGSVTFTIHSKTNTFSGIKK